MPYDKVDVKFPVAVAALGDAGMGRAKLMELFIIAEQDTWLPIAVFSDPDKCVEVRDTLNDYPNVVQQVRDLRQENTALLGQQVGGTPRMTPTPPSVPAPTPPQPQDQVRQLVVRRLNAILGQMVADNPARAQLEALLNELG